jgi:type II restriction/modification system DNA methylase subunit YeeA
LKYFEEEIDHSFYFNKKRIEEFFTAYLQGDAVRTLLSEDVAVARKLNEMLWSLSPYVENMVGSQFTEK